jgi:putative transposase
MGRPLRIEYPGAVYHIISRGNERREIFLDDEDRLKLLDMLADYHDRFGILIHCYVLMDNHYHLVIETPQSNLLKVMHGLNSGYTGYFNRKYNRSGHLFQGRYKAIIVDKETYLLELSRYVHLNPVRASMTKKPEEYAWSSYTGYIKVSKSKPWIEYTWILDIFGDEKASRRKYKKYVDKESKEGKPFDKLYSQIILGTDEFIVKVKKLIGKGLNDGVHYRKRLSAETEPETIIKIYCDTFKISREKLFKKGPQRNAAIYLMKRYSGLGNREIGELFGGMHFTAISKTCSRFEERMADDSELSKKIGEIISRFKA